MMNKESELILETLTFTDERDSLCDLAGSFFGKSRISEPPATTYNNSFEDARSGYYSDSLALWGSGACSLPSGHAITIFSWHPDSASVFSRNKLQFIFTGYIRGEAFSNLRLEFRHKGVYGMMRHHADVCDNIISPEIWSYVSLVVNVDPGMLDYGRPVNFYLRNSSGKAVLADEFSLMLKEMK
jgi:hypothetical protein